MPRQSQIKCHGELSAGGPAWLGLDIGGANLKVADCGGFAKSVSFPLWLYPERLSEALAALINAAPTFDRLAVTMTGEMADCYETRQEGVICILEQLTAVVPAPLVRVYGADGQWRSVAAAARDPWVVAAANWQATATWAAGWLDGDALVIDLGSTTCDLTAIVAGQVLSPAATDRQRLQAGQLVYTGVERSPVSGLVDALPVCGELCPVINELFATTADVYVWLGQLPEQPQRTDSADGRPWTRPAAGNRLARQVGEDRSTLSAADIDTLAQSVRQAQLRLLQRAWQRQANHFPSAKIPQVLVVGHGDFLVEQLAEDAGEKVPIVRLESWLGREVSRCASARAVAVLAAEQLTRD